MKLLFCSDLHFRYDLPINRMDDFLEVQINTLKFISKVATQNKCPIIIAADLFYKPKPVNSIFLENTYYNIFKENIIYFIRGNNNHDLLYGNYDKFEENSIAVLSKFPNWNYNPYNSYFEIQDNIVLSMFDYNEEIKDIRDKNKFNICVFHKYCEKDDLPEYINDGITAKLLLEKYDYDIFVVGDNHKAFEYKKDNRFVFNTGCISRQNLNEKDYQPSIILFDTETKKYEKILLPDQNKNVFKEENLTEQIKRESRIDSFIDMVGKGKKVSFSFESNLKNYCKENNISEDIINEIEEVL